jgi:hypothetical protein
MQVATVSLDVVVVAAEHRSTSIPRLVCNQLAALTTPHGEPSAVGAAVAAPEAGPAAMAAYPVSSDIHAQGMAAAQATPVPRPVPDGTQALPQPQVG